MAGQSGVHLMHFFEQLKPLLHRARASGSRCYLLCHSMGNWALQAAVESWFSHGNGAAELFDEAILAAADEQFDSFEFPMPGRLSGLTSLARYVSVLYSQADAVLAFSEVVNHGMPRLGQGGPHNRADAAEFPLATFRMIDCTNYQDYPFGVASSHQYYRRSPSARRDIISVLQ
jgi:esterase/lipase superfamily enzyme